MKGFTVENWKLKITRYPVEDAFSIDRQNGIIAVADGVTRDPMEYLPNIGTPLGMLKFLLNYPRPSPAKIVSNIFVETFPLVLRDYNDQNRDEKAVRGAFEEANKKIKEWNDKNISNPNYVMNDFAGCVAAGTSNQFDVISFGYLTDAGIAIFDSEGNLKSRTENQGPDKYDKYIWQDKRLQNIDWRNPEARRIIRREYRNNFSEKHSFGVLTGEDSAMNYVKTGALELRPGNSLIVYTDGLESTIFSGEFADLLRNRNLSGIEKLCKKNIRTEGTLAYHYNAPLELSNYSDAYEREWRMEQVARDN